MVLLARVERLRENPPSAEWDGSWHLDQKGPGLFAATSRGLATGVWLLMTHSESPISQYLFSLKAAHCAPLPRLVEWLRK
jgi:hypothetical protein